MREQRHHRWMGVLIIVAIIILSVTSEGWTAQKKYPNKTIQLVVVYQPGLTDMILRLFVDKFPEYLGQPVAFDYKPGAAGSFGASFVARAKPDGYTLLGCSNSSVIGSPITKEVDYTLDDFVPICRLVKAPVIASVKADSPWKTLKDLVEEAKKSPGKVNYATSGVYGTSHMPVEMFAKSAGINMTHVPCNGDVPAVTATLGGHVNMASCTVTAIVPYVKSGALRPIAVFSKERLKEYPDVPTFSELGYPVVMIVWWGVFAPKRTPKEVAGTLYNAFKKVVENQRSFLDDRLGKLSLSLEFLSPEESAKELNAEYTTMKNIFHDLNKSSK